MELAQLEMLVAMVEEGSFHKAAERVFRTQPAVSMRLRKLEEELGSPLFDRSTRHAYSLTETGEVLYDYAKRMLNLRQEAIDTVQELQHLRAGRIRIGANDSTSVYLLPRLVLAFHRQHPKVKVETFRHVSTRLSFELRQRNLDVAILSFAPQDPEFEAEAIMKDELVLIASPEHRLAGRSEVHIRDLGDDGFIAHNVRSPSREKVIQAFHSFHTPLRIVIEMTSIEAIKQFVVMGLGLAFVPKMCVREEIESGTLVALPVEGFQYERTIWMVRRRTESPSAATKAFCGIIADAMRGNSSSQPLPDAMESSSSQQRSAPNLGVIKPPRNPVGASLRGRPMLPSRASSGQGIRQK